MDDGKGSLSFNKTVTLVALVTFVIAVLRQLHPTWEVLTFGTVVIGAGFGLKGYLGALKRQTTNATVSATSHIDAAAVIKALREPNAFTDDERG
jgi:hypothetical protein